VIATNRRFSAKFSTKPFPTRHVVNQAVIWREAANATRPVVHADLALVGEMAVATRATYR
jgi:hypothetical protein